MDKSDHQDCTGGATRHLSLLVEGLVREAHSWAYLISRGKQSNKARVHERREKHFLFSPRSEAMPEAASVQHSRKPCGSRPLPYPPGRAGGGNERL